MLSVENEKDFKSFDQFWMRLKLFLIQMVEHEKEIFNIRKLLTRVVILSTNSVSIRVGSDSRNETQ